MSNNDLQNSEYNRNHFHSDCDDLYESHVDQFIEPICNICLLDPCKCVDDEKQLVDESIDADLRNDHY